MKLNDNLPVIYVSSLELSLQFYVNALGFKVIYLNEFNTLARVEFNGYKLTIKQNMDVSAKKTKIRNKEVFILYADNIDYLFSFTKRLGLKNVQEMFIDYFKTETQEYIEKSFKISDPDNNVIKFYEKIDLIN